MVRANGDFKLHTSQGDIPYYDGVFDEEGNPLEEDEVAQFERAKLLLGGKFQTWLYISLSREMGNQRLAVRFAHACCQRWPCVFDSSEKNSQLFPVKRLNDCAKKMAHLQNMDDKG